MKGVMRELGILFVDGLPGPGSGFACEANLLNPTLLM
jgi:hypothetical protein